MYPAAHAATTPDKPAIVMAKSGRAITYRELEDNSSRFAKALYDIGLRKGDVLALLSDNSPEAFEIYWAAMRSGLYITAINRHLSAAETAYIIDDCDAKVAVTSAGIAPLAEAVAALTPGVQRRFAFGGPVAGHDSYEDTVASVTGRLTEQPRGSAMLYSSGTTGRPKGIRLPLLPLNVDEPGDPFTDLIGGVFGLNSSTVYLSPAPVYHAAPLRWCATVQALGGTVVMMEKFDAEAMLAAIEKYKATATQVVPTMFVRMLQLDGDVRQRYDLSSLTIAVHAAAPCPPDVKQAMIDWIGPILTEYYGSTEGNGITVITSPEWAVKRGSVGRSMLGPIHICDDDGVELPAGQVGLVYFERDVLPFEYHKDPEKTASAQHPQHPAWTAVGDLGYLDEDGYLFLTDRKSFMIISGGVNIYPQEIEDVLALHPSVYDLAVIGVPDPEMGQQVKAVVQLRENVAQSPELAAELIAYVRERVAHFKAPKTVDFVDELPRTPTGKLVKAKLVERYGQASSTTA
jgi:fatty-acyl-CoA synthase